MAAGKRGCRCRCTCVAAIALHGRDRDAYEVFSSRWAQTSCRRACILAGDFRDERGRGRGRERGVRAALSSAKTETRTATRRLDEDDRDGLAGGENRSRRFRGKEDGDTGRPERETRISIISGEVRRHVVMNCDSTRRTARDERVFHAFTAFSHISRLFPSLSLPVLCKRSLLCLLPALLTLSCPSHARARLRLRYIFYRVSSFSSDLFYFRNYGALVALVKLIFFFFL